MRFTGAAIAIALVSCRGDPPRILRFVAEPAEVSSGGRATLSWDVGGAVSVAISADSVPVLADGPPSGAHEVVPAQTTTYVLAARSGGGLVSRAAATVVVNQRPTIVVFAANPRQVRPGETTTLTWTTVGATAVGLTANGAPLSVDPSLTSGEVTVAPRATTVYVLTASAPAGESVQSLTVPFLAIPVIRSFAADKPLSDASTPVVLAWEVVNPEPTQPNPTLRVRDHLGNTVPLGAYTLVDTVTVRPVRSTTYTLTASSAGGDAVASTAVAVNPNLLTFTASPPAAAPGDTISLSWRSAGATQLDLTEGTRAIATITDPQQLAQGQRTDSVPAGATGPLSYRLSTAPVQAPCNFCDRTVSVPLGPRPVISKFAADPPAVLASGRPTLVFQTSGAASATIRAGTTTLTTISSLTRLANGSYQAPAIAAATSYEFEARSAIGVPAIARTTVAVALPAQVAGFTATPPAVANGGDPVTLAWTTTDAVEVLVEELSGLRLYGTATPAAVAAGSLTVRPATAAEFRLTAYGAARDRATAIASVAVGTPLAFSASPSPAVAGERTTLSWDLTATGVAAVTLTPPPVLQSATAFEDIAGTGAALTFSGVDDAIVALAFPAGFAFPFAGTLRTAATVSTNGWIGFGAAYASSYSLNDAIPAAPEPGEFAAPFWDDLRLGTTGKVVWELTGTAPTRRLVVQWDGVEISGLTSSALTFEAILHEGGDVEFRYKSLAASTAARAQGSSASIGVEFSSSLGSAFSVNTASLTGGTAIRFPAGGGLAPSGTGDVVATASTTYTLLGLASGTPVIARLRHPVVRPGDLVVAEVMYEPPAVVASPAGEWIEIANASQEPIDLSGMTLSAGTQTHVLGGGAPVPAGGRRVLGGSTDPAQNGGASVDAAYTGLVLDDTAAAVGLALRGRSVASLAYDEAAGFPNAAGAALVRDDRLKTATGAAASLPYCLATTTYGTAGGRGTPGGANDPCFYTVSAAPGFVDVSGTGAVPSQRCPDAANPPNTFARTSLVALPYPFAFFGTTYNQACASENGWLAFGPISSSHPTNQAMPSTATPNGLVAAFWDFLSIAKQTGSPAARIVTATTGAAPNRVFVVQWSHFDFPSTSGVDADLNFEVKLHEGGDLEIQYDAMTGGDAGADRASGQNASAGIENPAGTAAIELFANTLGSVRPSTGWRFKRR